MPASRRRSLVVLSTESDTSLTRQVGVADAVIDLSRASLRAASSDVRKTGSTEEPSQYRNAVDAGQFFFEQC